MSSLQPARLVFVSGPNEKQTGSVAAIRPDGTIVTLLSMILWALEVGRWIWAEAGLDELEVTSGPDGRHSWASCHNSGAGADERTRTMTEHQRVYIEKRWREEIGPDFDLVFEGDHFHLEWQPKGPGRDVRPRRTAEWFPEQERTA